MVDRQMLSRLRRAVPMVLAGTVFLSAFLLFQIQPLISRLLLPTFGGASAVWTTCMLFFQTLLLGGYAYAHFSTTRLKPKTQALLHLILLVVALALMPITPSESWKAHLDGTDLGEPVQIDGGSNGWWLPASNQQRTVTLDWPPQGSLDRALLLSLEAVIVCLVVALRRRAVPFAQIDAPPTLRTNSWHQRSLARSVVVALAIVAEMQAVLSGRDAQPLRLRTRPIHG